MVSRERRRHFRGSDDGGVRIPVRHRARGGAWQDGETLNIGSGGAFVIGATWPVDSPVELAVEIGGDRPLVLTGVVRWIAGDGSAAAAAMPGDGPAGVGVQFLDLDLDVIIELNRHLAALAEAGDDEPGDGG